MTDSDVLVHNYNYETGRLEKGDKLQSIVDEINQRDKTDYTVTEFGLMNGLFVVTMDGEVVKNPNLDPNKVKRLIGTAQWERMSEAEQIEFVREAPTHKIYDVESLNLGVDMLAFGMSWDITGEKVESVRRGIFSYRKTTDFMAVNAGDLSTSVGLTLGWNASGMNQSMEETPETVYTDTKGCGGPGPGSACVGVITDEDGTVVGASTSSGFGATCCLPVGTKVTLYNSKYWPGGPIWEVEEDPEYTTRVYDFTPSRAYRARKPPSLRIFPYTGQQIGPHRGKFNQQMKQ